VARAFGRNHKPVAVAFDSRAKFPHDLGMDRLEVPIHPGGNIPLFLAGENQVESLGLFGEFLPPSVNFCAHVGLIGKFLTGRWFNVEPPHSLLASPRAEMDYRRSPGASSGTVFFFASVRLLALLAK
jgi:hypothetical protein